MLSRRQFDRRMYHCFLYELEDIIAGVEPARVVMPSAVAMSAKDHFRARLANKWRGLSGQVLDYDPQVGTEPLDGKYDLFCIAVLRPQQLSFLRKCPQWKQRTRLRVCLITEMLAPEFTSGCEAEFKAFGDFDHIFLANQRHVEPMQRATGRPCHYLPFAVDAERFNWLQGPLERRIDCYTMGRRNEEAHQALLEHSAREDFFYLHDTARFFDVTSYREHRAMLAKILKRSRYTLCDRRDDTDMLLPRMYEAACSGTVMLGAAPETPQYRDHFDWPDAMIPVPQAGRVASVIAELDRQPGRIEALRRTGARQTLLRHDWVHRWEDALKIMGVAPAPGLAARKAKLASLALGGAVTADEAAATAGHRTA